MTGMLHGLLDCTAATKQTHRHLTSKGAPCSKLSWVLPAEGPCLPGWTSHVVDTAAHEQMIVLTHRRLNNAQIQQVGSLLVSELVSMLAMASALGSAHVPIGCCPFCSFITRAFFFCAVSCPPVKQSAITMWSKAAKAFSDSAVVPSESELNSLGAPPPQKNIMRAHLQTTTFATYAMSCPVFQVCLIQVFLTHVALICL